MLTAFDLGKHSLSSLYELMTFKIQEFEAMENFSHDTDELREIATDIKILQDFINIKKVLPINTKPIIYTA